MREDQVTVFRPFRLNLINEQLWKGEELIPLRPQCFALLNYLVNHPCCLLTKNELLEACWSDPGMVQEAVLKGCIQEIRKALGDEAEDPKFIATVHRRGYRFIGTINIVKKEIKDSLQKQESSAHLMTDDMGSRFYIPHATLKDRFFGRDTEIHSIEKDLKASKAPAVSLQGIAGVGKTQLAAEYAHRKCTNYTGGCFWIDSQIENRGPLRLLSSLASLQIPLGLRLPLEWSIAQQAEAVVDILVRDDRPMLIIFDNADNWKAIRNWVHRLSKHHILVTTHNPQLCTSGELLVRNLNLLDSKAALDLLLFYCEKGIRPRPPLESKEYYAALSIVERLGRLPLALEIAAAYLHSWPDVSFGDYDHRLIREGLVDTLDDSGIGFTYSRHAASVRATFGPTWKGLNNQAAVQRLLVCAAYFASESIRSDLLAKAAGLTTDQDLPGHPSPFGLTLKAAIRTGFLEPDKNGQRMVCHHLVRDFIRSTLSHTERLVAIESVATALSVLWDEHMREKSPNTDESEESRSAAMQEALPEFEHISESMQNLDNLPMDRHIRFSHLIFLGMAVVLERLETLVKKNDRFRESKQRSK